MKQETKQIFEELKAFANDEKRTVLTCFFKTAEGQYGAGDRFLGVTVPQIREALRRAPGVTLEDDPQHYVYPMPLESAGKDDVFVGRVRKDLADDNGCTLWLTGDQIRKGAALNAVQIAEYLFK